MSKELEKQLKRLDKRENKLLNKKKSPLFQSTVDPMKSKLQDKVPDKLRSTLELAFYKSFKLLFDKGSRYIEKTYKKDKLQLEHAMYNYALDQKMDKRYIKKMDRQANQSQALNTSFSIVEGGVLGFLGIGLPDIPLFISVIIRSLYELSLSYGYDYAKDVEKKYLLLLICGAMTEGDQQKVFDEQINALGTAIDQEFSTAVDLDDQIQLTANVLSEAMLVSKFLQGIPVVGLVGGAVNYHILRKIGKYAGLKYKKRYLMKKQ